jgi:hypothetical protein
MKGFFRAIKDMVLFMIPGAALIVWGLIELMAGPSCDYQPMVPGQTCAINGGTPVSYGQMASSAHAVGYPLLVIGAVLLLGGGYVGARAGRSVATDPRHASKPASARAVPGVDQSRADSGVSERRVPPPSR